MKENGTAVGAEREGGAAAWREIRSADGVGESGAVSRVELRLADLIAERVAARLQARGSSGTRELIDANEVARILGCRRSWVYEHQAELGALRLGNGPRPRLRFNRAKVEVIAAGPGPPGVRPPQDEPRRRAPRRRLAQQASLKLLEIKGQAP